MRSFLLLLTMTSFCIWVAGQPCDKLNLKQQNQIDVKCTELVMTMTYDLSGRPYMYLANKEAGLTIYKMGSTKDPLRVAQVSLDSLDNLEVMGVSQYGNRLYLALGNFFTAKENPGMAIIDVSDPENPKKLGFWKFNKATEGSSLVKVQGDYAFLAAFSHGLLILDISDPLNIKQVAQFVPKLNFPDAVPDPSKINARGMVVHDDLVYLCYDAGGIRIIDVSDKKNPEEVGRFSNPVMTGKPRAYNNAVLRDSLLYVGVDYCGVEILNISDTANIKLVSWWNPWTCETSPLNWFSSNGHVNEVVLDSQENKLFVSTGKSDLHVVDVSDPENPDSCSMYGGLDNGIGTWGVNRYQNKICLSYICTFVPFTSNYSGVKLLEYDRSVSISNPALPELSIVPNPTNGYVELPEALRGKSYQVTTIQGKMVGGVSLTTNRTLNFLSVGPGIYILSVEGYRPARILVQ